MNTANFKELCALTMVGDGVLAAIQPTRHVLLWKFGPKAWVRTLEAFDRHPNLTRALGVVAAVAGVWWASRQKPANLPVS